jgi:hypothetical protein
MDKGEFRMIRNNRKCVGAFAAIVLVIVAGIGSPRVRGSSDKDKIIWIPVQNAILQVDSRAPKEWNVFQPGKKFDPLLVQIGSRFLVIYVRNMEAYEIKPEQLLHRGDFLIWVETDKPAKPLPTSDWSTKDVGSATRILLKLTGEGRVVNIELPKMPDLRRGIY